MFPLWGHENYLKILYRYYRLCEVMQTFQKYYVPPLRGHDHYLKLSYVSTMAWDHENYLKISYTPSAWPWTFSKSTMNLWHQFLQAILNCQVLVRSCINSTLLFYGVTRLFFKLNLHAVECSEGSVHIRITNSLVMKLCIII